MKNTKLLFACIAALVILLAFAACPPLEEDDLDNIIVPSETLVFDGHLDTSKWLEILDLINERRNFVALDLSRMTYRSGNTEGGLILYEYTAGASPLPIAFDPMPIVSTGKRFIVCITLPDVARVILPAIYQDDLASTPEFIGRDRSAFRHFTNLQSVTGNEINFIGNFAFIDRTSLREVNFPRAGMDDTFPINLHYGNDIDHFAFSGCTSLRSITFPEVRIIGESAFEGCIRLEEVNFRNVEEIGDRAFENCTSLRIATFRNPVTSTPIINIGDFAFFGSTALETLDVGNTVQVNFGVGALANIGERVNIHLLDDLTGTGHTQNPVERFLGGGVGNGIVTLREINFEVLGDTSSTRSGIVSDIRDEYSNYIEISINGVLVPYP